jgi:hypothetical protein
MRGAMHIGPGIAADSPVSPGTGAAAHRKLQFKSPKIGRRKETELWRFVIRWVSVFPIAIDSFCWSLNYRLRIFYPAKWYIIT